MKIPKRLILAILIFLLSIIFTACTQGLSESIIYVPASGQREETALLQEEQSEETTASFEEQKEEAGLPPEQSVYKPRRTDWMARQVTSFAAGAYSSFAVQTDGSLWGWGIFGDIGFGAFNLVLPPLQPRLTPVKLLENAAAVAAGGWMSDGHVLALKDDGSLWGLGLNSDGRLGDGTTTDRHTPVKIMDNVLAVSAGIAHTMAITSDNVLWGWGHNGSGRIGYAATAHELNPIHNGPIRIMDEVASVSAGLDHTLIIKTDGTLWAFGNNAWGKLGGGPVQMPHNRTFDHTHVPNPNPIKIMDNVKVISAGDGYSMAVTADGVLWAWGFNAGRVTLGIGRAETATGVIDRPIKVMDEVEAVSSSARHTIAVRSDKSLWAWGDNMLGQLGDGTQDERGFPFQIMDNIAEQCNLLHR